MVGNIMKFKMLKAAFAGLVLTVSGFTNATIILDFDDYESFYLGGTTYSNTFSTYQGFDFYNSNGNGNRYGPGNNGSAWAYLNGHGGNTFIELSGGGNFSFNSLYTRAFSSYTGTMGLVGYLDGNLVASQGFGASSTYTLVSALDSGFTNIDRLGLLFYGGEGYRSVYHRYIDDLSLTIAGSNSIPEPSTLAILALGLFGLGARRFKK